MLEENGVSLQMTDEALHFLADVGYDPEFGARPVKRALQRYLLNELAKELLGSGIDRSKPIRVEKQGEGLTFRN
jgi:ATP-dependent Clp protease ATP-binding subunit ClpB